jgi:hypothetical protein
MTILTAIVGIICLLPFVGFALFWFVHEMEGGILWRYDENHSSRICPLCGQQQDEFVLSHGDSHHWDSSSPHWYEPVGQIKDRKCYCHNFCKPQGYMP